ncbi:MAG TPA: hypothetical protein VM621_14590 [Luteibacter sp.]|uniref:hypothetical protein n=1 Tax=Luteibacter sp. TaxID=1886636 RepID=UPI002D19C465|nr:hypothetical protein [Luteibacter sp.]HVI56268.1 hypothetical protein [Luteibacter sp.]
MLEKLCTDPEGAEERPEAVSAPVDWAGFQRFLVGGADGVGDPRETENETMTDPTAEPVTGASAHEAGARWQVQGNRRQNLVTVLKELGARVTEALIAESTLLGVPQAALRDALAGRGMGDAEAREIEWSMNRPVGWMDWDHGTSLD